MRARASLLLLPYLVALAACGSGGPETAALTPDVSEALEVWRRGAEAVPASEDLNVDESGHNPPPFTTFDEAIHDFLKWPRVQPAVHWGCCVTAAPQEWRLEKALTDADPVVRMRALVVLVRVRASRSLAKQWAVLRDLSASPSGTAFAPVLEQLAAEFEPRALAATLAQEPPPEDEEWWRREPRPGQDPEDAFQWAIRAAGVTRSHAAIPRLREFACDGSLRIYLAAERSLEELPGPEADEALAACVERWRDQASDDAASALRSRDPERLRASLLRSTPREDDLRLKGIHLARLDDPASVPILCGTVGGGWGARRSQDREMLDAIERLATRADLPAVEGMLERESRFLDMTRVRAVVDRVSARVAQDR